jgi:hypothetical protein
MVLALLVLLALVCSAGSTALGLGFASSESRAELPSDGAPIATSPQAAARFVQKLNTAGERAVDTRQLSLTVTESEVTSFLNLASLLTGQVPGLASLESLDGVPALQGTGEAAQLTEWLDLLRTQEGLKDLDPSNLSLRLGIKEPEVRFKANGQIVVRGYVSVLFWRWPIRVVVAPRASQGELVLDFVEGRLGRIGMPEVVFDLLGKGVARAILAGREFAEVSQLRVDAGQLVITGRYKR